jgi:hypothetical protein
MAIGKTRIFNGKTYKSVGLFDAKKDAVARFKSLKAQGYKVRISHDKFSDMGTDKFIPRKMMYVIWSRR